MHEETKKFIALRQPFSAQNLTVVDVEKIGGGKPNDCSNNTLDATEAHNGDVRSVTGWLVHRENPIKKSIEVVQHWWNKREDGTFFDITPGMGDDCEYVLDMDLIYFVHKNYDAIESMVASSVLLKDGKIYAAEADLSDIAAVNYRLISDLKNTTLFKLN